MSYRAKDIDRAVSVLNAGGWVVPSSQEGLGPAIADRLRRATGEGNIVKGEKAA